VIGYWIVMAMVTSAVAAVVLASVDGGASEPHDPAVLPPDEPAEPIVIAALGASDATGEGANDPERENWLAQLEAQLPARTAIRNFGVGGSWLAAAYETQIPSVVAVQPDIVIGWLIVNDLTQGETLEQYLDVLERSLNVVATPGRPVILGNAPQLWNLPAFTGDPSDIEELRLEVLRWNFGLAEVAARYDATIVDLSQDPVELDDLAEDGFHPSTRGHAKLAATFKPFVLHAIERIRIARMTFSVE
jgi:lysophospholipase L1-like esterase